MLSAMQYRVRGLPTMATGPTPDTSDHQMQMSSPIMMPHKPFPPCPPPAPDMMEPAMQVKQEPIEDEEEEEEQGMVIDLTPRGPLPVLTGGEESASSNGGSSSSHHHYNHPNQELSHASYANHRHHHHHHYHHSRNEDIATMRSNFPSGNISSDSESGSESNSNSSSIRSSSGSSGSNGENMVTGTFRFSIPKTSLGAIGGTVQPRAKREFVPDSKKDASYWNKRLKNNDSARRSRIKRKTMEKLMEHRMVELQQENMELRYELNALKRMFGEQLGPDYHSNFPAEGEPSGSASSSLPSKALSTCSSTNHSTSSSPAGGSDEDMQTKCSSKGGNRPPQSHQSRKPMSRGLHNGHDFSPKNLTTSQPLHLHSRSGSISSMTSDTSSGATSAMPASESCTEASPCSSSSPQGSPGSMSGPQTSEEEGSSGASRNEKRGSSGPEDESLQKMPWKCRMKRGLQSMFNNHNSTPSRDEEMK